MTEWTTVSGTPETNTSALINKDEKVTPHAVVGTGGLEINGTGPVQHHSPVTHTMGQDAAQPSSIMDTVKADHGGQIIERSPHGNDVVSIGGMTTTINAAVAAGFLIRNQDGSFSDKAMPEALRNPAAEARAKAPSQETPKPASNGTSELSLSTETTDALTKIATTAMPGDITKAVNGILMHGEVDANTLTRMAGQMGVEPTEVNALWEAAHGGFYDAGANILGEGGIDDEAFGQWANSHPATAQKLMEASRALVMTNDTSGLKELQTSFYESADKFMPEETRAALTEAGFDYQDTPEGLKVVIDGTLVSFGVAVKQQIIRFI